MTYYKNRYLSKIHQKLSNKQIYIYRKISNNFLLKCDSNSNRMRRNKFTNKIKKIYSNINYIQILEVYFTIMLIIFILILIYKK